MKVRQHRPRMISHLKAIPAGSNSRLMKIISKIQKSYINPGERHRMGLPGRESFRILEIFGEIGMATWHGTLKLLPTYNDIQR